MLIEKTKFVGIISLLIVSSAWAERPWPETTYDCQVETVSGARGLVTIQASSLAQAERNVVGHPALTPLGPRELSKSVKECLKHGKAKFSDASFQQWRDRLEG